MQNNNFLFDKKSMEPITVKQEVDKIEFILEDIAEGKWPFPLDETLGYFAYIVAIFAFVIILFKIIPQKKAPAFLRTSAIIVGIIGFFVYFIGYYSEGSEGNPISLILFSLLSSLKMFVSEDDLVEVCDACKENYLYMAIFPLVHFLAVVISGYTLFLLLGKRFQSWVSLIFKTSWIRNLLIPYPKELYVFFSINDASISVAKGIQKKKDCQIIFIEEPVETEDEDEEHSFFSIVSFLSFNRSSIEKLYSSGVKHILAYSSKNLAEAENTEEEKGDKHDIWGHVGLKRVRNYVSRADSVHVFLFAPSHDDNIRAAMNLHKDILLNEKRATVYCLAKRTPMTVAIEKNTESQISVKIADASYLSVYQLKANSQHHPVRFIDIDTKKGCATTPFNSLIVGFDETGKEALSFLYEFGAFVQEDGSPNPFKCYVIDKEIDKSMSSSSNTIHILNDKHEREARGIEFINLDYKTQNIWSFLAPRICSLNYVVIAVGNDIQGMDFAVNLYKFACMKRNNDLSHFKIFVRVTKSENENRLQQIADYYNIANKDSKGEIVIFGKNDDIYSYENIVADKIEEKADKLAKLYAETSVLLDGYTYQKAKEPYEMFKIQSFRRKKYQNIENSLHIDTKFCLMGLERNDENYQKRKEKLIQILQSLPNKKIDYYDTHPLDEQYIRPENCSDEDWLLLSNLAKTEHLRWNASHEMLGYTGYEAKDYETYKKNVQEDGKYDDTIFNCHEVTMKHGCLTTWDNLNNAKKVYDFITIISTLRSK